MRERVLLIDDTREETAPNIQRRLDVIARNYWEGIKQLQFNGPWDILLLDHDLSSFDTTIGREFTGYDVMCFLEANPEFLPKKIILVTANPIGRVRMQQVIDKLYP